MKRAMLLRVGGGMFMAWLLVVLLPDLYARLVDPQSDMSWRMKLTYAVVMASSCALWLLAGLVFAWLRGRAPVLAWMAMAVFAGTVGFASVATTYYQLYFNYTPKPVIFAFFLQNLGYLSEVVASGLGPLRVAAMLGVPVLLLAWMGWLTSTSARAGLPARLLGPAMLGALFVPVVNAGLPGRLSSLPPDYIGMRAGTLGTMLWARQAELPMLPVPRRVQPPPSRVPQAPNVVLFINESIGARQVPPWVSVPAGHPLAASRLAARLQAAPAQSVWFPQAVTVAPLTNVALPAMLSGLSPDAPVANFRQAPLLWHEAQAAGMQAAMVSAQDFKYSFFKEFFLGADAPAMAVTAGQLVGPRTVDSGVDDALAADAAIAFLEKEGRKQPFLLVVQFNGSHFPCWDPANPGGELQGVFDDRRREARCRVAAAHIDAQFDRVVGALERLGLAESTAVISTADHGDVFDPQRPRRPVNFYEDTLSVPLAMLLPRRWAAEHPELVTQLRANRSLRASNLDIFPTVLDLWGRWPRSADDARPALAGHSLLRPLPPDRVLVAGSRTSIYEPPVDNFAVYRGSRKWMFDERTGLHLFDLDADPFEKADLAAAATPQDRLLLRQALDSNAKLRQALASNAQAQAWAASQR